MATNNGNNPVERFDVHQFFVDGSSEKVTPEPVLAEQAVLLVKGLVNSVGAKIGTTQRIIVTDWGDSCVLEWQFGKGVTFPLGVGNGKQGT